MPSGCKSSTVVSHLAPPVPAEAPGDSQPSQRLLALRPTLQTISTPVKQNVFMSNSDDLMKPEEVAAMLGVPVGTLYQWRYRSEGPPSMKVGRHVRYRRRAVEAWLDELTAEASK